MNIMEDDLNVEIIGFGALNLDKLYQVENIASIDEESFILSSKESSGGSASNTIMGLSSLGVKTSYIGKIAEDSDGDTLEYNLSKKGVYTSNLIYSEDGVTGNALVFVDSEGNRAIYLNPGVNDNISIGEINLLNINRCKILHFSSFVGEDSFNTQKELVEKINKDTILSFDPGMIYVKKGFESLNPILNRTNILLINENELRILFDDYEKTVKDLAMELLNKGIGTVVIKQGSKGVFALNKNEDVFKDVFNVKVVDTTGAGDLFNTGFLYSYLKGYSLLKSCTIGNWFASKYIQYSGNKGFPNKEDLENFEKEI